MTSNLISGGLAVAAVASILGAASGAGGGEFGLLEFVEYIQSGASVAAVMGIFLWRETKKNEKLDEENKELRNENRQLHDKLNDRCLSCSLWQHARMLSEAAADRMMDDEENGDHERKN